jgi:hypothetical protein
MALTWALWLGPAVVLAQAPAARRDAADPRLTVSPPTTESAFAGYRSFRDEPLADWRAVNDEVRGLGGHAGHIRDGAAPADRAPPAGDRGAPKPAAAANPGAKHAH